jgi:predicted TIM-barrel fold metal-dependent hydrolase
MLIIDAHAHIYPDKIAEKAALRIGEFYGIPMRHDGTVGTLLATGKAAGVGKFLVHSVATVPEQVASINNFIAEAAAAHSEFIGFATLHPGLAAPEAEVERVLALGLRGVKLHPDFQKFQLDDPELDRLYKALEGRLPLLIHAGDSRYNFSGPGKVKRLLRKFPGLNVIAAHFGGWSEWEEAERTLVGERLWVDTSSSLPFLSPGQGRRLIEAFGPDRVLFGTDYPMWDAGEELERFAALGLPEAVKRKVLGENLRGVVDVGSRIGSDIG